MKRGLLVCVFFLIFLSLPKITLASENDLVISEIFPCPETGEYEWIEFYNPGSENIVSSKMEYTIEDGTGVPFYIYEDIPAKSYKVIRYHTETFTNILMNNDGDKLVLKKNGEVVDSIVYGNWPTEKEQKYSAPAKGKSLSRYPINSDMFITLNPSPGSENIKPYYPDCIMINEVLPDPEDGSRNEFIELYNNCDAAIDLSGWQIDDIEGGSNPYSFDKVSIEPKNYLVIFKTETRISLNNDKDSVRLIDPNGELRSMITYDESTMGESYAYFEDGWVWTSQETPNMKNICKPSENIYLQQIVIGIVEARALALKEKVRVSGFVTVAPGILSDQYFYIQDSTGGLQVYCYKKDFPELKIGDELTIAGELSEISGERRIKISSSMDISKTNQSNLIEPVAVEIKDIKEQLEGQYVTVTGKVSDPSVSTFYITNGSNTVKIIIKDKTGIEKPRLKRGQKISISGIVSEYKGEYRILPTRQEDVRIYYLGTWVSPKTGAENSLIISVLFSISLWIIYLTIWKKQQKSLPKWQVRLALEIGFCFLVTWGVVKPLLFSIWERRWRSQKMLQVLHL